jgi:hypothetical protein
MTMEFHRIRFSNGAGEEYPFASGRLGLISMLEIVVGRVAR